MLAKKGRSPGARVLLPQCFTSTLNFFLVAKQRVRLVCCWPITNVSRALTIPNPTCWSYSTFRSDFPERTLKIFCGKNAWNFGGIQLLYISRDVKLVITFVLRKYHTDKLWYNICVFDIYQTSEGTEQNRTKQSNLLSLVTVLNRTRSNIARVVLLVYSARGSFPAALFGLAETLYRIRHGVRRSCFVRRVRNADNSKLQNLICSMGEMYTISRHSSCTLNILQLHEMHCMFNVRCTDMNPTKSMGDAYCTMFGSTSCRVDTVLSIVQWHMLCDQYMVYA